jgi:hypothetical protein
MSTGHKVRIKGSKLDKSGTKVMPDNKRLSVSKQLQKKGAQRIRIGRRGTK